MSNHLAMIHIGKKALGLDDETYRAMISNHANGKTSAKDCTTAERQTIIDHMKKSGVSFTKSKKGKGKRPSNYASLPAYVTKVEAQLADMGLPWSYADSIARNITGGKGAPAEGKDPGVERLAWVTKKHHWVAIIAALHTEQEKRSLLSAVDTLLASINKDHAWVADQYPQLKKGWSRNRIALSLLIDTLQSEHGARYPEEAKGDG